MAGRNAQPISVLKQTGKKHLTKKEIATREAGEIKFGSDEIICPDTVSSDIVAYKKWLEITRDYAEAKSRGIDLFKSSDIGILERYCLNYSLWVEELGKLKRAKKPATKKELRLAVRDYQKEMRADEDRLLLNILAKIKNVPQQPPQVPKNPMKEKFGI